MLQRYGKLRSNNMNERIINVIDMLNYLYTNPIDDFMCQNGLIPLFGTSGEQWNTDDAVATIVALVDLWDNWYER